MQRDLRKTALTFFTSFTLVFASVVGFGLALGIHAQTTPVLTFNLGEQTCPENSQFCNPLNKQFSLGNQTRVFINYDVAQPTATSAICSSFRIYVSVDGILRYITPFFGWPPAPHLGVPAGSGPLSTGLVDIGEFSAGSHILTVQEEGRVSGCNSGILKGGGGEFGLFAEQAQGTPTPTATATVGTIGDFVWRDTNGNGIQNGGEPGVSGVAVDLRDCSDSFLTNTSSNGSGFYQFSNLAAGCYKVKFHVPAGFVFSPRNATGDASDSDAGEASGVSHPIDLSAGETDFTVDAGLISTATPTPTPTTTPSPTPTPTPTPTSTPIPTNTPTPTPIPAPQCSDGHDNDGDDRIDSADPGCHTDNDPSDGDNTYNPNDNDERDFDNQDTGDDGNDDFITIISRNDFLNFFKIKNTNVNKNTNTNNNSNDSDNDVHVETGDVTVTTGSVNQTVNWDR